MFTQTFKPVDHKANNRPAEIYPFDEDLEC